jgi:hypothetical protein
LRRAEKEAWKNFYVLATAQAKSYCFIATSMSLAGCPADVIDFAKFDIGNYKSFTHLGFNFGLSRWKSKCCIKKGHEEWRWPEVHIGKDQGWICRGVGGGSTPQLQQPDPPTVWQLKTLGGHVLTPPTAPSGGF